MLLFPPRNRFHPEILGVIRKDGSSLYRNSLQSTSVKNFSIESSCPYELSQWFLGGINCEEEVITFYFWIRKLFHFFFFFSFFFTFQLFLSTFTFSTVGFVKPGSYFGLQLLPATAIYCSPQKWTATANCNCCLQRKLKYF